jgi:hypothetical protein
MSFVNPTLCIRGAMSYPRCATVAARSRNPLRKGGPVVPSTHPSTSSEIAINGADVAQSTTTHSGSRPTGKRGPATPTPSPNPGRPGRYVYNGSHDPVSGRGAQRPRNLVAGSSARFLTQIIHQTSFASPSDSSRPRCQQHLRYLTLRVIGGLQKRTAASHSAAQTG